MITLNKFIEKDEKRNIKSVNYILEPHSNKILCPYCKSELTPILKEWILKFEYVCHKCKKIFITKKV